MQQSEYLLGGSYNHLFSFFASLHPSEDASIPSPIFNVAEVIDC